MSVATSCEGGEHMMFCASCGVAGGDDIKLKKCNACHLVKYCSVKCQKDHWQKHKKECKKRAAELHDEILFRQPESSHYGDCPICCLPIPIDEKRSTWVPCCCKHICNGCFVANERRETERRLQHTCPFCRTAAPNTGAEIIEQLMKRVEANDPVAMCHMGSEIYKEGNYNSAFEYFTKAAAMGNVQAHYQLSILYRDGQGVEKNEKRELHHAEKAAIRGHPHARCSLGCFEWENNAQMDRAVKHFIIGAKLGHDMSLDNVKMLYEAGYASKEDFGVALRGYQAAIEAAKSPQREAVAEYSSRGCDGEVLTSEKLSS